MCCWSFFFFLSSSPDLPHTSFPIHQAPPLPSTHLRTWLWWGEFQAFGKTLLVLPFSCEWQSEQRSENNKPSKNGNRKTLLSILVHFMETAQKEAWPAGSFLIFAFSDSAPVPSAPRRHLYSASSDAGQQLHHFQLRERLLLTKAWEVAAGRRSHKEKPKFQHWHAEQSRGHTVVPAHTPWAVVTLRLFELPPPPSALFNDEKSATTQNSPSAQSRAGLGTLWLRGFLIEAVELDENKVSNRIFVFHQYFSVFWGNFKKDLNTAGLSRQIFCCYTFVHFQLPRKGMHIHL